MIKRSSAVMVCTLVAFTTFIVGLIIGTESADADHIIRSEITYRPSSINLLVCGDSTLITVHPDDNGIYHADFQCGEGK